MSRYNGLGLHAVEAAQLATNAVNVVHAALDDEGDDGDVTSVVERETLSAEYQRGIVR